MGELPPWFGRDRERQNRRSQRQETKRAKEVGGRPQGGSGSSWRARGDVKTLETLEELKFTTKSSYSLKMLDWRKIRAAALAQGRTPRMVIDLDVDGKDPLRLVVTEDDVLERVNEEMCWAAGLFVGEGTVFTTKSRYLQLAVSMYDRRALVRFRNAIEPYVGLRLSNRHKNRFGARIYKFKSASDHTCWRVQVSGNPAIGVCRALYPYLARTDKGDQMAGVFEKLGLSLDQEEE